MVLLAIHRDFRLARFITLSAGEALTTIVFYVHFWLLNFFNLLF